MIVCSTVRSYKQLIVVTDLGLQSADRRVLISVDGARHDTASEHRVARLQQQNDHVIHILLKDYTLTINVKTCR